SSSRLSIGLHSQFTRILLPSTCWPSSPCAIANRARIIAGCPGHKGGSGVLADMRAVAWVIVIALALGPQATAQAQELAQAPTQAPAKASTAKAKPNPKPAKKAAAKTDKEKPAPAAAPSATPEQRAAYASLPVA